MGSASDARNVCSARRVSRPPPAAAADRALSVTSARSRASFARNDRSSLVSRTELRWSRETRVVFSFSFRAEDRPGFPGDPVAVGSSYADMSEPELRADAARRNAAPRRESRHSAMSREFVLLSEFVSNATSVSSTTVSSISRVNNSRRLFSLGWFFSVCRASIGSSFSSAMPPDRPDMNGDTDTTGEDVIVELTGEFSSTASFFSGVTSKLGVHRPGLAAALAGRARCFSAETFLETLLWSAVLGLGTWSSVFSLASWTSVLGLATGIRCTPCTDAVAYSAYRALSVTRVRACASADKKSRSSLDKPEPSVLPPLERHSALRPITLEEGSWGRVGRGSGIAWLCGSDSAGRAGVRV